MQLFCFAFAGGSASFFDPLEQYIGPSIEVVKLEYAGHGARRRENFYSSFSELAGDLYGIIKSRYCEGEGYALLGYSMGSISAVETLKKILYLDEMPPPAHVFLAAHGPHAERGQTGYNEMDPDELVRAQTIRFGGIPENLVDNKTFWRVYLPVYRADYALIENYNSQFPDWESGIPATVFYSETDTPYADIVQWKLFLLENADLSDMKEIISSYRSTARKWRM